MRISELQVVTLREAPSDATTVHERLLRRSGFVRKVEGGVYFFLPLGVRVLRKIAHILRSEFEHAGFHPIEPPLVGASRETLEAARGQVRSWRSLPLRWYWIGGVRDENLEPKGGLLHTREWSYLQAWVFDAASTEATESARLLSELFCRALRRTGLDAVAAEGEQWWIIAAADVGPDRFLQCTGCGKRFAPDWCAVPSGTGEPASAGGVPPAEVVSTPNLRTVEEVARFLGVEPSGLVKTLLVEADGRAVAALVRGDHELSLPKLRRALGASHVEMLSAERVEHVTRAPLGFAGPVALEGVSLIADYAVRQMQGFVVGANLPDAHRVNVCWGRDFAEPRWADIRMATAGDRCASCGGELLESCGILLATVGSLSTPDDLVYDDVQGRQQRIHVTASWLNLTRAMAALVETNHDMDGIVWHPNVAPYEVIVLVLNPADEAVSHVAERLTEQLREAGLEVLVDDRDERAGAKFKDADLMGIPLQVVLGRGIAEGVVEIRLRRDRKPHRVAIEDAASAVLALLLRAKEETE